jgi:hypothetical protein
VTVDHARGGTTAMAIRTGARLRKGPSSAKCADAKWALKCCGSDNWKEKGRRLIFLPQRPQNGTNDQDRNHMRGPDVEHSALELPCVLISYNRVLHCAQFKCSFCGLPHCLGL